MHSNQVTVMTELQTAYEQMKKTVQADSKLSDADKYQIMFGQPYIYKDPWKGVNKKTAE